MQRAGIHLISAVAGLVAIGAVATAVESEASQLYVKKDAWPETMVATRARYLVWRKEMMARPPVTLGPWYATGQLKASSFKDALFPQRGVDLDAKGPDGTPLWQKRPEWKDGAVHHPPNVDWSATYLFRTLTVEKPSKLRVYLGSDDSLAVWLNGTVVFSRDTQRGAAPDQETVELILAAGENALLLKVYNYQGGHGFYFSTTPTKDDTDVALWQAVEGDFPVETDWMLQDARRETLAYPQWFKSAADVEIEKGMIGRVIEELGPAGDTFKAQFNALRESDASSGDVRWLALYAKACERRRTIRLEPLLKKWSRIVFTKHYNMGGSHYAYTEGLSNANAERHFVPGTSLCVLEMGVLYGKVQTLIEDAEGVIRDPDVSHDGKRILFSWKKSDRKDDYHLYEMDVATGAVRQLTFGLGFADYEGAYLPNGDIVFNSTRCVQIVDCWWTEVSNLYACDKDGRYLRRLSFDQVHTNYPTVTDDGRVLYTRWEYSDRGQLFPQPLFQMNPDGTKQTEFYGNNSWFPTTIMHARGIPETNNVVAILSGHHSRQFGKLAIIDPGMGRQENSGVQLIAPVRETPAERIDGYGQHGELFQYPYPLSETEFLVAYDPLGYANEPVLTKIYFMTSDGRRELLAADPKISCNQPVPLAPRAKRHVQPSLVDYRKKTGTYYVQDVYAGPGLAGVPRGTIKRLRVVALEYRAAGVGANSNAGPAGGAVVCTPVAIPNGTWDVKVVLGSAPVCEDGSACFTVPARVPVYFQALDEKGRAVQTMRSWSTLQPGEFFSCIGCHEPKNMAPPVAGRATLAMEAGPKGLEPFYGPPRGFSFRREIQPILDRRCIQCHGDRTRRLTAEGVVRVPDADAAEASEDGATFSLLETETPDACGRQWSDSYLALTQAVRGGSHFGAKPKNRVTHWISAQSIPPMLPPYHAGAARSPLIAMLEKGHEGVKLTREEMDKIACWIDLLVPYCGSYVEANAWGKADVEKYEHFLGKRQRMEAIERTNIEALIERAPVVPANTKARRTGGAAYLSPVAVVASKDGKALYVAEATANQVAVFDTARGTVTDTVGLGDSPSGLALSLDGARLYVTVASPEGRVHVVNTGTGRMEASIPAGHTPMSPVVSPDGATLYVCNRFNNDVSVINLNTKQATGRIGVVREPVAAAVTPDGRWLFVANHLPGGRADGEYVAAAVSVIDIAQRKVAVTIQLPNGSTGLRGICVSPDGKHAYVTHVLARYQVPTTQLERGWMNTSGLSVIDVEAKALVNTVLLDDVDMGAANPWGVACTSDGNYICVAHAGTHEVSVIDRAALHGRLEKAAAGEKVSDVTSSAGDVPNDLGFLVGIRRRVKLAGNGARGLAIVGNSVYVAEYFSDSIGAVDLDARAAHSIALGPDKPLTAARKGEMFFNDARLCFQQWQSCASCHPDGRADGLNWDLLNDGFGNLKNTKSLLLSHETPPVMVTGVRPRAETAVRAGLKYIQFAVRTEEDARVVDAYLKSLRPVPSPYLVNRKLSTAARRGERVYRKANCAACHDAPLYTDLRKYDVGTGRGREKGREFDTPTIVEIWRTAPYLYDGRAATMREVLTDWNEHDQHGATRGLNERELADLIEFVLSQ